MNYYFQLYKPYQVLSQFSPEEGKQTLADFFDVPKDVYPVGRLDFDSEGLLLLTNDKQLNHRLLHPKFSHQRSYWVQVDGAINEKAIHDLSNGVDINLDGKIYRTKNAIAKIFETDPIVPDRNPPIRFRKEIPAPWIQLILTEGKNRQVRKMTAKVGFPTLRLIRNSIEGIRLDNLQPGEMITLTEQEIYQKLFH
ncbi:MAG: pseudouridine synthase [Bacteroidetes bacterium]|nr:pseudouridine synthase [Bacteroidota bacterium]